MDLRDLSWFLALAETNHVSRTADALHISQPTLSRAILRIEQEVGVSLFTRTGNRLQLNRYGEVLRAHAARMLQESSVAQARITSMVDPEAGLITIAYTNSLGSWLVPELIRDYRAEVPNARFSLRGTAADSILDLVRKESVDVGIMAPRPVDERIAWIPVVREDVALTLPIEAMAGVEEVSLHDLKDATFVALFPEFGLRQIFERLCAGAGFEPQIEFETTEIPTLWALVAAGLGYAVLPANAALLESFPVRQIPIDDEGAHRDIGAVSLEKRTQPSAVLRFLDFIRDRSPLGIADAGRGLPEASGLGAP